MRKQRYVKPGGELKLLYVRTERDCPFLRPDRQGRVNALVLGVLAQAQAKHRVKIFNVTVLPHDVRILAWFRDTEQMTDFMEAFDGNLSKVVGSLEDVRQRGGSFWRDRYRDVSVNDDVPDQVAAFKEVLAAPCEDFVDRPVDWPGVHCAKVLSLGGARLRGAWYGQDVDVLLSPLPCWSTRPLSERRKQVHNLLRQIENETTMKRQQCGKTCLGVEAVLQLDPRSGPQEVPRWTTPRFFALDEKVREEMRTIYLNVVKIYRRAADALHHLEPRIPFPVGTLPPPLPPPLARSSSP